MGNRVHRETPRADAVLALLEEPSTLPIPTGWEGLTAKEPHDWRDTMEQLGRESVVALAIEAVRQLGLPIWEDRHPGDVRPQRALEAASMCLSNPGPNARRFAQVAAKGCSAARKATIGYGHRIAESARAVANAAERSDSGAAIEAALLAVAHLEDHLAYEFAIDAVYGKEAQIRRAILGVAARPSSDRRPGGS